MSTSAGTIGIFVDSFEVGGTELNALRTAEALERLGHQLVIFHAHVDGPLFSRWENTSHRLVHIPVAPMRSAHFVPDLWRLGKTVQRHAVKLVHSQDIYTNIWLSVASKLLSLPPIITSRRWDRDVPRRGFVKLNAFAHQSSALVTVNSSRLRAEVIRDGVADDRVTLVTNFIEPAKFADSGRRRETLRSSLGISPAQHVVGIVGRLVPVKRFDLAIRAFSHVARITKSAVLMVVGDGPEAAALHSLVAELRIEDQVRFLGHRSDSWSIPSAFDCFLLSSEHEGFANTLLEAAANGVPVLSTDVGGAAEVLSVVGGSPLPTGDADAMANALIGQWNRRVESSDQAQRCAGDILERFADTQVMNDLVSAYARVLSRDTALADDP